VSALIISKLLLNQAKLGFEKEEKIDDVPPRDCDFVLLKGRRLRCPVIRRQV